MHWREINAVGFTSGYYSGRYEISGFIYVGCKENFIY